MEKINGLSHQLFNLNPIGLSQIEIWSASLKRVTIGHFKISETVVLITTSKITESVLQFVNDIQGPQSSLKSYHFS